ncbi:MAG: hypothetical protein K6T80_06070 [Firmicutes bacterium]|nr:hypothetical protein [Bacillota bacterium]
MGGCSGDAGKPLSSSCFKAGGDLQFEELVKATSIEEAGKLVREGLVLLAVYWNCARSSEEYILGRLPKKEGPGRKIGFSVS